jgi:hypothetical protein
MPSLASQEPSTPLEDSTPGPMLTTVRSPSLARNRVLAGVAVVLPHLCRPAATRQYPSGGCSTSGKGIVLSPPPFMVAPAQRICAPRCDGWQFFWCIVVTPSWTRCDHMQLKAVMR